MAVSHQTTRVRRVLFALVIAGVLIFGAYLLANPSFFAPSTANAESTQELLAAYAQKKGPDGLPLWEDQLIATASSTAWAATTTTQDIPLAPAPTAAAGSLTDDFAQNLFSQYMSQEAGNSPSDQDIDTFADNAIQQLVATHSSQNIYTQSQVKVSGSGPDALKVYAAAADKAIEANTVDSSESELDYFSDAIEKNDPDALKEVAAIGQAYTGLAPALMQIQVPTEAQYAHLEIANAAARLGEDITDMSTMETDPLRAYLGLSAYQTDATSLAQGFSDMATIFQGEQVTLTKEEPGYGFYTILEAASSQATSTSQ